MLESATVESKGKKKKVEKDKTLTILLTRGPFISEYADLATNLALKARRRGYKVNMFLYLDGTWVPHVKRDKDYSNPGEWLKWAMKKGVTVRACERCSSARDITEDDIQEGVLISGMYSFIDMLAESDKVITFTG